MTPFDSTPHPTGSGEQLWLECVEKLAQELPEQQFNTWIKPLQARVSEDQTKITILVGNRFKLDWVRTQSSLKRLPTKIVILVWSSDTRA